MRGKLIHKILFLFISFFSFNNLYPLIRNVVKSVKVIKVNSIEQKIENFNKVTLTGDVEVLVDDKIHMWADTVEIDKENETLIAKKGFNGFIKDACIEDACVEGACIEGACVGGACVTDAAVVIESDDLLILADEFFLNLKNKKGEAKNLRVHVPEGYICAKNAQRVDDDNWQMEDIVFTPCDAHVPHWSIVARRAVLYKNYLVRFTGLLFKVGPLPFFTLPYMVLPLQKRSKSGFLLPKISYDNDLGIGLRQEFYWSIASRCDSTLGVDWREKKGLAFIDEFRWSRSEESFTLVGLRYALEKNAFVKKRDRIEQDTDRRYWIDGKDFRTFKISSSVEKELNSLLRVDFGTDKKIGYQFFDNFLRVDDTFYNSWILRYVGTNNIANFYFDSTQAAKSKFLNPTDLEKQDIARLIPDEDKQYLQTAQKEIENKFAIVVLPHLEWNNSFKKICNNVFFRQDFFVDHVFSREKKQDRFYVNSKVVQQGDQYYLAKADSFRLFYNADLQTSLKFKDQSFLFYLEPNFQLRTNLKDRSQKAHKNVLEGEFLDGGVYRLFGQCGAQWVMPELFFEQGDNYNYYLQPSFSWTFLPKFKQDHWYHSDKWDRYYATNKLEFNLNNSWNVDNILIDLNFCQGLDFYNKVDRFALEKSPNQEHLFPLNVELGIDCDVLDLSIKQEYDWKILQLLSSQFSISFSLKDFNFYFASVYQHEKLQQQRALFSDIPNFLILSLSVPLVKNAKLLYEGQFYSEKKSPVFPVQGLKPLQHAISIDYQGHCWGISLGYEEKRYKEYGNWKSDKAYTLFIKLESLGSFARKFKPPVAINRG
ncbi:MAG: hypothetical protein ABIF12_00015 [bacterium]